MSFYGYLSPPYDYHEIGYKLQSEFQLSQRWPLRGARDALVSQTKLTIFLFWQKKTRITSPP